MAFGHIAKEKKKQKGKKNKGEAKLLTSDAPVFVLPKIVEKRRKSE